MAELRHRQAAAPNQPAQPKVVTAWATDSQWILLGAAAYLSYVGLWLAGLCSPLLVLAAMGTGRNWLAACLVLVIIASYLPRSFFPVIPLLRDGYRFAATRYFRRSTMLLEASIDESVPTIYCIHPHGIFCIGWAACTLLPQLSHLTWCFSSALEKAPFFRIFLRLLNKHLAGTSKATILRLLREKRSLGIIPGGFEEATLHCAGVDRVYIKKRRGLFKYALQHGPYRVVPVYAFGERDTYSNLQGGWSLRLWINSFSLPAIVPFGARPTARKDRRAFSRS